MQNTQKVCSDKKEKYLTIGVGRNTYKHKAAISPLNTLAKNNILFLRFQNRNDRQA